jgi:hypothetical protein
MQFRRLISPLAAILRQIEHQDALVVAEPLRI